MRRKAAVLLLAAVCLAGLSMARADTVKLDLLYAIVSGTPPQYDNAEHWTLTTSMRVFMSKEGKDITIYMLTCYINTGDLDTRRHEQRIDLITPDGEKTLVSVTNPVDLTTIQDKQNSFQRAYVSAKIDIPAMDTKQPENFGIYTIKVYLDGDLVAKYPYPILAR